MQFRKMQWRFGLTKRQVSKKKEKKDTGAQREEPPEKKSEERWERRGEVRGEREKKDREPRTIQKVKYTRKGQLESPGEFSPSP